jgi:hypothetical protein
MARYATSVRDPIRHLAARAVPPEDGRTSEDGKPIGALWEGLPIEALRLEADTIALLHRLGVLFCRQLRALPRASLAARLGEHPAIRMAQLTGEIAEWIEPHRPPPEFRESYQLENPTACRRSLDAFIQRLLKQLTEHLRQAGQGAIRLLCRLNSADGGVLDIDVGLFRPTISANHLWDLIEMQLEQAITPAAVRQIVLEVMVSTPLRQKQGELFGGWVAGTTQQSIGPRGCIASEVAPRTPAGGDVCRTACRRTSSAKFRRTTCPWPIGETSILLPPPSPFACQSHGNRRPTTDPVEVDKVGTSMATSRTVLGTRTIGN